MIRLIWLNFELFCVVDKTKGKSIIKRVGTFEEVGAVLAGLDVPKRDIDFCLEEMQEKYHNVAEFGVLSRSLIFTDYNQMER